MLAVAMHARERLTLISALASLALAPRGSCQPPLDRRSDPEACDVRRWSAVEPVCDIPPCSSDVASSDAAVRIRCCLLTWAAPTLAFQVSASCAQSVIALPPSLLPILPLLSQDASRATVSDPERKQR